MIEQTTHNQDKEFSEYMKSDDILDLSIAIDYIRKNFNPDDIFSADELERWAEDYGYILE